VDLAGRPLSERRKPNMNSKVRTKATLQQRVSSLIAGTQVHFPTGPLTVGGVTSEPSTLVQLLKSLGDAIAVADGAKAKLPGTCTVNSTIAAPPAGMTVVCTFSFTFIPASL
jgi:hypothetical protein